MNSRVVLKDTNRRHTGDVTYRAAHYRVEAKRGKPRHCSKCGRSGGATTDYAWAHTGGPRTDVKNYRRLCVTCHNKLDGPKHAKALEPSGETGINAIADAEAPALTNAFLDLWTALARRITVERVEAAMASQTGLAALLADFDVQIEEEPLQKAIDFFRIENDPTRTSMWPSGSGVRGGPPIPSMNPAVNTYARINSRAARATLAQYPQMDPNTRSVMEGRLDVSSPYMRRAALTQTAWQVQGAGLFAKRNIQTIIYDTQRSGLPPEGAAAMIRATVGLGPGQGRAVWNYRRELGKVMAGDVDPSTIGPRGYDHTRGRWKGRWTLAPKPGKGRLTSERINRMTVQYAGRLQKHRAQTIARTETIRAANLGQQMTWEEMARRNALPKDFARRWDTAVDERTCGSCMELDGQETELRGQYRAEVGRDRVTTRTPPLHANCRCTLVAVRRGKGDRQDSRWHHGRAFGLKPDMTDAQKKSAIITLLVANPFDEIALALGAAAFAGGGAKTVTSGQMARMMRPDKVMAGQTIFERFDDVDNLLTSQGVKLEQGNYLIHGSGLLDGLDMRRAADIDLVVHPATFEQIKEKPGWYIRMAGPNKDHPVLQHKDLDKWGVEISHAEDLDEIGGRQVTIRDLAENTVQLQGRQFVAPDHLVRMKTGAMDEGAKVAKNKRDIAMLDGRFTWREDVRGFGSRMNQRIKASRAERMALQRYGKGSDILNEKLRRGARLSPAEMKQVGLIDAAISRGSTPHRVKVYRGMKHMTPAEAKAHFGALRGQSVREHAYVSTGLREKVSRKYGGQSGVFLELDVPAGSSAFYAPYRALAPEATPNKVLNLFGEDELLLPRGTTWRVKEVIERSDGTILVKGEIIPTALRRPPPVGLRIAAEVPAVPPLVPGRGKAPSGRISPSNPTREIPNPRKPPRPDGKPSMMSIPRDRPTGSGPPMGLDLIRESSMNVPDLIRRQSQVPGFEDFAGRVDFAALDEIADRQARILGNLADRSMAIGSRSLEHHATWYPFAKTWTTGRAAKLNKAAASKVKISGRGFRAATASLSPGADWANNVAWADWVATAISTDVKVDRRWVITMAAEKPDWGGFGHTVGKRISQLTDEEAAYAIRARYSHDPVMQLGKIRLGDASKKANPNSLDNIEKAVSVLRDDSHINIDKKLGGNKVRSFYNNLENPKDRFDLNVTVDTHHFGAANGQPYTTGSRQMKSNSDGLNAAPGDKAVGVNGTYPIVTDATRRATAAFNAKHGMDLLPNEFQSVVWEMHRAEYPDWFRPPPEALMSEINALQTMRAKGTISWEQSDRLQQLARRKHGAPTADEIRVWFEDDLAGRPRRPIKDVRHLVDERRTAEGRVPRRPPVRYLELPENPTEEDVTEALTDKYGTGGPNRIDWGDDGATATAVGPPRRRVFDLLGASPENAADLGRELDRLAGEYPETMKLLGRVETADLRPGVLASTSWGGEPYISAALNIETYPAVIKIAMLRLGSTAAYRTMLATTRHRITETGLRSGKLVANMDTGGVMRHEFGHIISAQIANLEEVVDEILELWGKGRFDQPSTRRWIHEQLSEYGAYGDGLGVASNDVFEFFSEVFSEAHGPNPRAFATDTMQMFKDRFPELFR